VNSFVVMCDLIPTVLS